MTALCTTSTFARPSALSLVLNMEITYEHEKNNFEIPKERIQPRHRKRSSSLVALESLGLPSPPSSPLADALESTSTSGEIPIIFAFLTTNSNAPSGDRIPQAAGGLKPILPPLAKFSPMSAFFPMHDSDNSINTQAFGDGDRTKWPFSGDSDSGASSPTSPAEVILSPCGYSADSEMCSPVVQIYDCDAEQGRSENKSGFTISSYLESQSACDSTAHALHSKDSFVAADAFSDDWTAKSELDWSLDNRSDMNATITQRSTKHRTSLCSASFQASSPEPSLSRQDGNMLSLSESPDLDDKTPTQSSFLKDRGLASTMKDTISQDSIYASSSVQAPLPGKPVINSHYGDAEKEFERIATSDVQTSLRTEEDCYVSESTEVVPKYTAGPRSSFLPVPSLKHALWLRDTLVELWIDQEGFRAVRPQFHLASVSSGLPVTPVDRSVFPIEDDDPLYTTVAEFLPVKRIAYPFHHAALDRAPCLTRVAVASDETRDFVTRTASLPLREDGVFFVSGTEDARIEPGRIVRLAWRFEYFVAHRISSGGGRGERLLTPLSFSCTPALLDRYRAHKVTVLHIMKKTLLSNLVAQKLEPPDIPAPILASSSSGASSLDSDLGSPIQCNDGIQHDSEVPQISYDEQTPKKETFAPPRLKSPPRPPLRYTKHRRGSHSDPNAAGAESRKRAQQAHVRSVSLSDQDTIRASKTRSIIGPIIPRAELMKLFDNDERKTDDRKPRPESLRFEVVDNVKVTLLPAPPRRKRA